MTTENFLFKQAATLTHIRWGVLLFVTILVLISASLGAPLSLFHIYLVLIILTAGFNIVSTLAYEHYQQHRQAYTRRQLAALRGWTYVQTLADLLLLTAGIHYTGGIHSPGIYLLIVYVAGMAMTYGKIVPVAVFTTISIVLFTLLFTAYREHWLPPMGVFSPPNTSVPPTASFVMAVVAIDGLLLTMAGITLAESSRLRAMWERSVAEWDFFSALHELSHHGLQYHDLQQTVNVLTRRLQALMNADDAFTLLWEEREGRLFPLAAYNVHHDLLNHTPSRQEHETFQNHCTLFLESLKRLQPTWLPLSSHRQALPPAMQQRFAGYQQMLLFPVHAPGSQRLLGMVALAFRRPPPDMEEQTTRAQRASEVVAPLFARALSLHKTSSRLALLEELANDVTGLAQTLSLPQIIPTIAENAAHLLNATAVLFIPSETAPTAPHLNAPYLAGAADFFARRCYENPAACLHPLQDDPFLQLSLPEDCALFSEALQETCQAQPTHLMAFFAIPSPRTPLGALVLFWHGNRQMLTPHEIAVGKLFAARAGAALYNAYLYHLLHQEARTDALTGLPNRRAVDEALENEWKRAQRYHHVFSIVMLDINHFKRINDRFGHQKGDLALQHAARLLKKNLRETDFVGRYGGDEFLVILPETDQATSRLVMSKVAQAAAQTPWEFLAPGFHLTLSYGIAMYPADGEDIYALVDIADKRLYENKPAS